MSRAAELARDGWPPITTVAGGGIEAAQQRRAGAP
jgi:hypothetical protein